MAYRGWLKEYNHAERLLWQNPHDVLSKVTLKAGDIFLDVGCGDGFFTIPAAMIVGPQGLVYGVDVSQEALDDLAARAATEGLSNIRLTAGDATAISICDGCADAALLANVLHDFEFPLAVLSRVKAALKIQGRLAVLDWKKAAMLHGPAPERRLDVIQASALLEQADFAITSITESGRFHYLIIAEPKSDS